MADISQKEIELLFQEEVLGEHGRYLIDLFYQTIEEKNIRVTDELLESLASSVFKEGGNRGLRVSFLIYGRFIEIRRHKRLSHKNSLSTNTNALIWGIKENQVKKGKDTDWYSANAYGSLNRLYSILSNELTQEEVARLKGILQNTKPL